MVLCIGSALGIVSEKGVSDGRYATSLDSQSEFLHILFESSVPFAIVRWSWTPAALKR